MCVFRYHHGRRWTDKFQHVVGVMHTNYLDYARREERGHIKEALLRWDGSGGCLGVLRAGMCWTVCLNAFMPVSSCRMVCSRLKRKVCVPCVAGAWTADARAICTLICMKTASSVGAGLKCMYGWLNKEAQSHLVLGGL